MFAIRALLVCSLLLLAACAGKTTTPPPFAEGQIVLPDGRDGTIRAFVSLAADADYVLLGERHDKPLDHAMQARLLQSLAEDGQKPLLGLEMLPRERFDLQLARFRKGEIPLEALPSALVWGRSWGYDFSLYAPVFAVARRFAIPTYGLNIPNDVRLAVSRKGLDGITPAQKAELPARFVPPLPQQREKLGQFFKAHAAMIAAAKAAKQSPAPAAPGGGSPAVVGQASMPGGSVAMSKGRVAAPVAAGSRPGMRDAFERFMLIQSLWDNTMAEQAREILRSREARREHRRPMVILAGGGHVEYGYGIAHRLRTIDPGARIVLVMPFAEAAPERAVADLFFYSPDAAMPTVAGARPRLGIALQEEGGRLAIVAVEPGSRAERSGLRVGDILCRAGSVVVASPKDLHRAALEARGQGRPMSVAVERAGEFLALYVAE
jgi:uncharacterized iron-regulated protein